MVQHISGVVFETSAYVRHTVSREWQVVQ